MAELVSYAKDTEKVRERFERGEFDFLDLTNCTDVDELVAMLQESGILKTLSETYPSPRKNEGALPVGVLVLAHILLRYHGERAYKNVPYVLRSGSVLNRFGRNAGWTDGFNTRNSKDRRCPFDPDAMRKFFKDTDPEALIRWFNDPVQDALLFHGAYDRKGIFILDSSWLFLPDNPQRLKDGNALRWRFDEDGHPVSREEYEKMSPERQAKVRLRTCYKLVTLLHTNRAGDYFVFAGMLLLGKDNYLADVAAGRKLIDAFIEDHGPGIVKLLIADRGFLDGAWIGRMKQEQGIDAIMPFKRGMADLKEALDLLEIAGTIVDPGDRAVPPYEARRAAETSICDWDAYTGEDDRRREKGKETFLAGVKELRLWESCPVPIHAVVIKDVAEDGTERIGGLATTLRFAHPKPIFESYLRRAWVEDRYHQLKGYWPLTDFRSTGWAPCTAQVVFILLVYSLLQLHLHNRRLRELARATIKTYRYREATGHDAVIVYWKEWYGVFEIADYTLMCLNLSEEAKRKALPHAERVYRLRQQVIERFRQAD